MNRVMLAAALGFISMSSPTAARSGAPADWYLLQGGCGNSAVIADRTAMPELADPYVLRNYLRATQTPVYFTAFVHKSPATASITVHWGGTARFLGEIGPDPQFLSFFANQTFCMMVARKLTSH